MAEKTITIKGKEVRMRYCTASEINFETLAEKTISDINFTSTADLLKLAWACIIAAYARTNENEPLSIEDLLYELEPNDIIQLVTEVITLRSEWYKIPTPLANELKKEEDNITEEERKAAEKNAPAPANDTASS